MKWFKQPERVETAPCRSADHRWVDLATASPGFAEQVCVICRSQRGWRITNGHPANCHAPCCDLAGYLM